MSGTGLNARPRQLRMIIHGTIAAHRGFSFGRIGELHERHHLFDRAYRGGHGHPVVSRFALGRSDGGFIVVTRTSATPVAVLGQVDIHWGGIIAGAICAAALASVLHAFAGAIGISLSSTAPTWRDSSTALTLLSGLYLILVALASYGFGAYVAARMRSAFATADERTEFQDGMNGLLVWALATLLTGLIVLAVAQTATRFSPPSPGPAETSV